ncbi:hypothetical protein SGFS_053190 [Streptomyces graminofaciens]|uniref:Uncharacterized protein n=1 Tax=Streptomyces graminofaciens TaxID=68212 RepID=A0ABM8HL93_9ACTN|nr:hypothetical protein SGFS_053190 [Streptomyces graminofaciens]
MIYAKAGIEFYWRIEQAATGVPLIYTYVLDPATNSYRTGDMFTGVVRGSAAFTVESTSASSDLALKRHQGKPPRVSDA